jgi:hypothetical protein
MTHILQPLDVGIFRPWKHWHNMAIIAAIRSLNIEYSINSFLHDLRDIRTKTFKEETIIHAFRDSGMWPVSSFAAAQRKMRQYKKNHRSLRAEDEEDEDKDYELPRIGTYWETQGALQEWENRIPKEWSSPSKARYSRTLYRSQCLLARGSIQEMETLQIRERFSIWRPKEAEFKEVSSNWRSFHSCGRDSED